MAAEGVDLVDQGAGLVQLGVAGGEQAVPEQGQLLFQLVPGGDHPVHPVCAGAVQLPHLGHFGVVPSDHVVGHHAWVAGIYEAFNHVFVTLLDQLLQLIAGCPEPGPTHQVSHQGNVGIAHNCLRKFSVK